MKTILTVFCLTSLLCVARAEKKAAPAIALKRNSTFETKDARDPFWPIGWTKPNPKNASGVATPLISPASFTLTSVTMGAGARFAILNGKVMQEGQQFGLQFGSQIYQVTVRAIQDGQVVLAYDGGEIIVPLRRH